jgi:hypothetical protein
MMNPEKVIRGFYVLIADITMETLNFISAEYPESAKH